MADSFTARLRFWEGRSSLGFAAGSGDTNLKELEINALLRSMGRPSCVLDAGCGNGYTIARLAEYHHECLFYGFDYSQGMVDSANNLMKESGLDGRATIVDRKSVV